MILVDAWEGDVLPLPLDWFPYICLQHVLALKLISMQTYIQSYFTDNPLRHRNFGSRFMYKLLASGMPCQFESHTTNFGFKVTMSTPRPSISQKI
jgi:hypothetical protein